MKTSGFSADKNSPQDFLDRICVNYLRHCLTEYEDHLYEISGKVGSQIGYYEIKHKVFLKIAEKYPYLQEECKRQDFLDDSE